MTKFRIKPNAALIAMVYERISSQTAAEYQKRNVNYNRVNDALIKEGVFYPGQFSEDRTYWLVFLPVSNTIQFRDYC